MQRRAKRLASRYPCGQSDIFEVAFLDLALVLPVEVVVIRLLVLNSLQNVLPTTTACISIFLSANNHCFYFNLLAKTSDPILTVALVTTLSAVVDRHRAVSLESCMWLAWPGQSHPVLFSDLCELTLPCLLVETAWFLVSLARKALPHHSNSSMT